MADRLVDAAICIILRDGLAALTFQAIETEAGASRSLIHYHFGGRTGLLHAVVDRMFLNLESLYEPSASGDMPERLNEELESDRRISADHANMLLLVELLPHILRSEELREQLQTCYRRGRGEDTPFLRSLSAEYGDEVAAGVAALMAAMIDGLGLQFLIDPRDVDHAGWYRLWEDMVLSYLEARRASSPERGVDAAEGGGDPTRADA